MDSKTICLPGLLLSGAPAHIQIIPFGRHLTSHGEFVLDEQGMQAMLREFMARENQMVIDYEHQTLSGTIAPAAGWIKRLEARGEQGLWAEVEWTPRARQFLGGCEYRYLSPVFVKDQRDNRVVSLINAALTNQPAIDGMNPIGSDSLNKGSMALVEKGTMSPNKEGSVTHVKKGSMTHVKKGSMTPRKEEMWMLKEMAEIFGLTKDEGSGSEEVLKAAKAMHEEVSLLRGMTLKVTGALGLGAEATASEIEGTVLALQQSAQGAEHLVQKLEKAEVELAGNEAGTLVAAAMKEGKVSPAQKQWAMEYAMRDAASFRVFAAKAPVSVPFGEVLHTGVRGKHDAGACALQAEVNRALGLSDDKFMKFRNREEV